MDLSAKCTKIIQILFVLLFALVPLLVTPWNYELFEYNKMMAVYAFAVLIATTWGIKMIHEKKVVIPKTPLDIPIALFVLSQIVSTLFSIDPHVSWFGYYSRFNGGLLSTLSYVALYYIFISTYSIQDSNSEYRILNTEASKKNKKKNSESSSNSKLSIHSPVFTIHNSVFSLLYATLFSAFFVALYGVLERMGVDSHLWVQDVQNRVFSTLGQPNWLAAYIVALIPLTWAMAIGINSQYTIHNAQQGKNEPENYQRWILGFVYWSLSSLFFFVLLCTRSKSGLGALAVADVLFWGLLFFKMSFPRRRESSLIKDWMPDQVGHDKKVLLRSFTICHVAFSLIVFFNGIYIEGFDKYFTFSSIRERFTNTKMSSSSNLASPSGESPAVPLEVPNERSAVPLLETGGTDSGVIRKYVWSGAITAWKSSIKTVLIGTGTESFAFAFFQYRPKEHNLTSEWDFLYNKAHNEYVNFLTTTGVLGLLSYLSILGVFIAWYIRYLCHPRPDRGSSLDSRFYGNDKTIQIALFAGFVSILITNFFGFSVVITQVYLFLFPAIVFVLFNTQSTNPIVPARSPDVSGRRMDTQQGERFLKLTLQNPFDKVSMWIIAVSGVSLVVLLGITWDADRLFAYGYRLSRAGKNEQAVTFTEQAIARNFTEPLYHDELATELAGLSVDAMDVSEATKASALAQRSIKENDIAITTSPKNVNFWKSRVKILYAFSAFDPSLYKLSLETLKQSQDLSPNDPKIAYNIAVIAGRQGDTTTAISALQKAIEMKPNYKDAYYALYIFYTEAKQSDNAKNTIRKYLTKVDPEDKEFKELVQ